MKIETDYLMKSDIAEYEVIVKSGCYSTELDGTEDQNHWERLGSFLCLALEYEKINGEPLMNKTIAQKIVEEVQYQGFSTVLVAPLENCKILLQNCSKYDIQAEIKAV